MKKNQNGFGVVEGLLTLVIIGILSGVGWYVWRTKNNADSIYKNASNTAEITKTNTSKNEQRVIKIPELDIEFTVPSSLKNLQWVVVNLDYSDPGNNNLGTYPTAYLGNKDLTDRNKGCEVTGKLGSVPPLGFLTKTPGQYPANPTADNTTGSLVKQFSDFYIGDRGNGGLSCFGDETGVTLNNDTKLLATQMNDLGSSLKTIKKL
jgi:hypothetical protein